MASSEFETHRTPSNRLDARSRIARLINHLPVARHAGVVTLPQTKFEKDRALTDLRDSLVDWRHTHLGTNIRILSAPGLLQGEGMRKRDAVNAWSGIKRFSNGVKSEGVLVFLGFNHDQGEHGEGDSFVRERVQKMINVDREQAAHAAEKGKNPRPRYPMVLTVGSGELSMLSDPTTTVAQPLNFARGVAAHWALNEAGFLIPPQLSQPAPDNDIDPWKPLPKSAVEQTGSLDTADQAKVRNWYRLGELAPARA